jgi:hypothetical protein
MKKKSQRTLYLRTCNSCWIDMLSTYPQDSTYRVYCETCYSKEIYW